MKVLEYCAVFGGNGNVINTIYESVFSTFPLYRVGTRLTPSWYQKLNVAEKRLLAIPLLYIFLRMWGTLQFFLLPGSFLVPFNNGCIPQQVHDIFFTLGVLQVRRN